MNAKKALSDSQASQLKQACRDHALQAYEDARLRGLCAEGAFELAMQAILDTPMDCAPSNPHQAGEIFTKRLYDPPSSEDGLRVLVDRLWPRGIAKADATWQRWAKELAPSTALRKWFHQAPDQWPAFVQKYRAELQGLDDEMRDLLKFAKGRRMTLLYASASREHHHAQILQAALLALDQKGPQHA